METPKTLLAAARYFANLDTCEQFMREIKWHGTQPACPNCGSVNIGEVKTRRLMRCRDCRKQFSSKVGTKGNEIVITLPISPRPWHR